MASALRSSTSSCFNTQPPEGGWAVWVIRFHCFSVSTHSRPKAAGFCWQVRWSWAKFQHTAARRRLGRKLTQCDPGRKFQHTAARRRLVLFESISSRFASFNTQPPEGGWFIATTIVSFFQRFNTQPPEGGWDGVRCAKEMGMVSTHSRPKAAGY